MPPVVSVLMPTFNRAHFLPTAIESVLAQEWADWELIVCDNASTDATPEIVQGYSKRDGRVKYFRNATNIGQTANFNLCDRMSDPGSEYLSFLSSDDWWEPAFLSTMVLEARECPSAALIHGDSYRTDASGKVINRISEMFPDLIPPPGIHRALAPLFVDNYIHTESTLINRALKKDLYPTSNLLAEDLTFWPDYHLWLQLMTRGAWACYVPASLCYYRKHDGALTMPVNGLSRELEVIRVLRDKLQGVCPPDLEHLRLEALHRRLVQAAFELLRTGQLDKARDLLCEARRLNSRRHLAAGTAELIVSLPISADLRAGLWRLAVRGARLSKGARGQR